MTTIKNKRSGTKEHKMTQKLESELAVNDIVKPISELYTRFLHTVNPGDLIAGMAAIKKYYDITKRKVIVAQSLTQIAAYYQGATHPTVNERGENVCCNLSMWEMLKPLIESQEYIHSFEKHEGQPIDIDLSVIRGRTFVNLPHMMIQSWLFYAYPDLCCDLSKPWVTLKGETPNKVLRQIQGKVILNFTERYRSEMIDYFFLKNYAPDLVFAGTEKEHFLFCNRWQLTIPRLDIKDFLELAYAIKSCRFFLGNQSFCWGISEAIKSPRILELCRFADNCSPFIGEDSYGYYHQAGAEYYFRILYNKTQNK